MAKDMAIAYITCPEEEKSNQSIRQDFPKHSAVLCSVPVTPAMLAGQQYKFLVLCQSALMSMLTSPVLPITHSHNPNPISTPHRHLFSSQTGSQPTSSVQTSPPTPAHFHLVGPVLPISPFLGFIPPSHGKKKTDAATSSFLGNIS